MFRLLRSRRVDRAVSQSCRAQRALFFEAFEPRKLMAVDFSLVNTQLVRNEDGSSAFTFQIHKTAGNAGSVEWSVTGSGANPASAADFTGGLPTNVSVSFPDSAAGDSTVITLSVLNDAFVEGNEGFTVTLSNPSAGDTIPAPGATANGTIQDNDTATVTLSGTAGVTEGGGTGSLTATLTFSTDGTGTPTLKTPITGVTLGANSDYTSSIASFAVDAVANATQTLTITATNDRLLEGFESSSPTLAAMTSNATVAAAGTGTVNVTDDESATLSIESVSEVTESGSQTIPISLFITGTGTTGNFALGSGITLTADVTRTGGTANSGVDFQTFGTQTVTFNNGATSGAARAVTVTTIDDERLEGSETILLTLGNLGTSGTATTLDNTANVTTLLDNDFPGNNKFVIAFDPQFFGWQRTTLPISGDGVTEVVADFPDDDYQDGHVGDFNGDGTTDFLARQADGDWVVGVSDGDAYNVEFWGWFTDASDWATIQVGDVNNDGKADLVGYLTDSGEWWAAISTGTSFENHLLVGWSEDVTWTDHLVADFTGDGRVDVAARSNDGLWWLAETSANVMSGTLSGVQLLGVWATDVQWRDVNAADYNGDGLMDIVGRADFANSDISQWWLSEVGDNSGDFAATNSALGGWVESAGWTTVIADINGDQSDDIVGRTTTGEWWIIRDEAGSNLNAHLGTWLPFSVEWVDTLVGDLDDDGKDDLIGRQESNGEWLLSRFPNGGPPAALSQQNNRPADWFASLDWMFAGYGEKFIEPEVN